MPHAADGPSAGADAVVINLQGALHAADGPSAGADAVVINLQGVLQQQ
jgi:hypothetical protein